MLIQGAGRWLQRGGGEVAGMGGGDVHTERKYIYLFIHFYRCSSVGAVPYGISAAPPVPPAQTLTPWIQAAEPLSPAICAVEPTWI